MNLSPLFIIFLGRFRQAKFISINPWNNYGADLNCMYHFYKLFKLNSSFYIIAKERIK